MITKFGNFMNENSTPVKVLPEFKPQYVQNPHPLVVSKDKEVNTDKTRILKLEEKIRKQDAIIRELRAELSELKEKQRTSKKS